MLQSSDNFRCVVCCSFPCLTTKPAPLENWKESPTLPSVSLFGITLDTLFQVNTYSGRASTPVSLPLAAPSAVPSASVKGNSRRETKKTRARVVRGSTLQRLQLNIGHASQRDGSFDTAILPAIRQASRYGGPRTMISYLALVVYRISDHSKNALYGRPGWTRDGSGGRTS